MIHNRGGGWLSPQVILFLDEQKAQGRHLHMVLSWPGQFNQPRAVSPTLLIRSVSSLWCGKCFSFTPLCSRTLSVGWWCLVLNSCQLFFLGQGWGEKSGKTLCHHLADTILLSRIFYWEFLPWVGLQTRLSLKVFPAHKFHAQYTFTINSQHWIFFLMLQLKDITFSFTEDRTIKKYGLVIIKLSIPWYLRDIFLENLNHSMWFTHSFKVRIEFFLNKKIKTECLFVAEYN